MILRDIVSSDENILEEINISKRAILIEWLVVPTALLVMFLTIFLPHMVKSLINEASRELVEAAIGYEISGIGDILFHPWQALMPQVPPFIVTFVRIIVWIAILSWLGLTIMRTFYHFGYEMIITDKRILARAKNNFFDCEWKNIKNVYVERSLCGKLFNYGSVTVQGERGVITVNHISNPSAVKTYFNNYTGNF